jgi:hypothetical protein
VISLHIAEFEKLKSSYLRQIFGIGTEKMRCTQDQSQANMDIIYTGSDLLKSNNHMSNINFVEYVFASYFF